MVSRKIICVDLGSAVYSKDNIDLAVDALNGIADQCQELCKVGYRIVAFVGPGWVGREYLEIAQDYTKNRKLLSAISQRASRVNALLLIDVLLDRGLRTKSTPFESLDALEEFVHGPSQWDVLVGERTSIKTPEAIRKFAKRIRAKSIVRISEKEERIRGKISSSPREYSVFRENILRRILAR
jgi:uridylate kinase